MTRVAAIDCGTNSIRLLIADVEQGKLTDVVREMRIVRLGQGVDKTGRFADEALARTFAACAEYATVLDWYRPEELRFVATSASRDAANRDDFYAGVQERLGVLPEVISGDEEAALSFRGAVSDLVHSANPPIPPYLVLDIGGGSTEFVIGGNEPTAARSVNVGCVRMTERHLHDNPPTQEQIAATVEDIDAAILQAAEVVNLKSAGSVIGVAGSVTTVAAIALELPAYDPQAIHGSRIPATQVHEISRKLLAMTRAERAAIAVMHEGRVDVIGAGALVLDRILHYLSADEVVVSETDILDGIALALAQ